MIGVFERAARVLLNVDHRALLGAKGLAPPSPPSLLILVLC